MKKLAILLALALALSTAALANPVFQDRGAEASNPLYEAEAELEFTNPVGKEIKIPAKAAPGKCEDLCPRPNRIELTVQTWTDPDSDGDGLLTLKSTELVDTSQGQIVSALKSERPKFKAGAELSKTARDNEPTSPKILCGCSWDLLETGDLDGDGTPDIVIAADRNEETLTVAGTVIDDKVARKGFIKTENHMNKAELIEQMASEAGLSKADAKRVLDAFINATTKDLDRR